jgi:hypothetical protein
MTIATNLPAMSVARRLAFSVAAVGAGLVPLSAQAATVYDTPVTTVGNQNYGDNLGLDFTVNALIRITGLGAFDSGANGISTDIFVGIYDLTNLVWVTPILNFNGSSASGGSSYAFQNITPFNLGPGNYSIVARGFNGTDPNFNTNIFPGVNGASTITFDNLSGHLTNGTSRYGGGAAPAAGTVFGYQSAFAGGSFVATAVPELATWAMMLMGFGMIGGAARYRRRATTLRFA